MFLDEVFGDGVFTQSLLREIESMYRGRDPAHDFSHIFRVCKNAKEIGQAEGANMPVLLLAALLHDAFEGPKGSVSRDDISRDEEEEQLARRRKTLACFLDGMGLSEEAKDGVIYAVQVHAFSRGIMPETLEAKILQDADRLDALGAVGIARVFMTGGAMNRAFCSPRDPFCKTREPDDGRWNLDHFYRKLLKLESGMHTKKGKDMARRRTEVMSRYLRELEEEMGEG